MTNQLVDEVADVLAFARELDGGTFGPAVEHPGATLTEHAVTVVGVRPGFVLINDPWFGQAWHSKAQFESAYKTFSHMAVIVGR